VIEIREAEEYTRWFEELRDRTAKTRILVRLARVRQGNFGDVEPVREGVSELKIDYGPGYRIYYKKYERFVVILLGGGIKKTQDEDIKRACELARQFQEH